VIDGHALAILYRCYGAVLSHWVTYGPWWQLRKPKGARKLESAMRYLVKTYKP
jgi:hypothetical protein